MDIVDTANNQDSKILESSIYSIRQKAQAIVHDGHCLNCGEPCEGAFCCPECREDYEHMEKCLKINGKIKND